ncbi:MAG: N-acetyl-gamma-glutamyl-phosphate reductase [Opitutaceae bacterium]|nr:N-acetyl-gamma-glutamyl-phosphate reductase [Cytophagales bacterium]
MIRVGIVGGAGYTGGELLRILVHHPDVVIAFVNSKSNAGNSVWEVHHDLIGDTDLKFSSELSDNIDVLFLCLGHGDSSKFINDNPSYFVNREFKIIDLSQDFRIHTSFQTDNQFIYGLPELNREKIKQANNIANPGCFATCIQLGLLPLASISALNDEVHLTAITGSTGAGQKPTETTHFSWRANNLSVYKAFDHQHLKEIKQSLNQLQPGFDKEINFIPYRGDFPRGIIANMHIKINQGIEELYELYEQYFKNHPFAIVTRKNPDLKQVINTNKAIIYLEKHNDYLLIISCIDNLVKGASGQAVQNMNIMFGSDETAGLKLKSLGY